MAKLIIHREAVGDDNFVPWKKVTFETRLNPELILDAKFDNDVKDQILEILVEEYKNLMRAALLNFTANHFNREIKVENSHSVYGEPIVSSDGTAAVRFATESTTVTTIKEKQNCD